MHSAQILAAVAALIPSSFAAPAPAPVIVPLVAAGPNLPQGGFTVGQIANGITIRNGALEVQKTFQKFAKPVPIHVAIAASSASAAATGSKAVATNGVQSGSVGATPSDSYDSEYVCPVQIGSNGQTVLLDFDTGSSDLWTYWSGQTASQRTGHHYYNTSTSTSATKQTGETWNIGYGDGSGAKGIVYSDKVVVGGATATSQAVECATSVSSQFVTDTSNDGLLGLAWPNINTASPKTVNPFFQTIQSSLASPVFTAYLKYHAAGSYDFGFINSSKYSGSITYTNVTTSNGFWEFSVGGYQVGSSAKTVLTTDSICDTGTTLMYLPDSIVTAYYKQVAGATNSNTAGGWIFPCSSTLPNFTVYISRALRTVPGQYMNYAPVGNGQCFGGIQSDAGIGMSILGDVFIKSQFVVFDVGNVRIGFATQK